MLDLHARELARQGGPPGIRDEGMLDSALARPENLYAYGESDLADLAAAYAFGLAKNHAFMDGNKRASLTSCVQFLRLNGQNLVAPMDDCIATWQALAAGDIGEADLAAWLRARVVPLG